MSYLIQLDYSALLGEPDINAFQDALSFVLGANFPALLTQLTVTLGLPTSPDSTQALLTNVALVSTNPAQLQPESISYMRMDIGQYMSAKGCVISAITAASAANVSAWLLAKYGIWTDPTTLTLSPLSAVAGHPNQQQLNVSVASSNYVWVGTMALYVAPANDIGLLAVPGISKGLVQSDVMTA